MIDGQIVDNNVHVLYNGQTDHFIPWPIMELCHDIQWNPSKVDTIGTKDFICCSEVSLPQWLVFDHAHPTITASYDKALLWTTKKTVLMRDLSTDSS